jgi:putative pyruvate formate lyase activating enzyme
MMLDLQDRGCHNINLVSPTHVVPFILDALLIAVENGLTIPLIYNTGGYDAVETLRLLDGVVDIYMPDMKYSDAETALQLSGVEDYPGVNRAAVREMHRQVGDLAVNDDGNAERGLLVRHLVLPDGLAGTEETVQFLALEISVSTYLNIMAQYHPALPRHRKRVAVKTHHGGRVPRRPQSGTPVRSEQAGRRLLRQVKRVTNG